jgi:hypothetical protein
LDASILLYNDMVFRTYSYDDCASTQYGLRSDLSSSGTPESMLSCVVLVSSLASTASFVLSIGIWSSSRSSSVMALPSSTIDLFFFLSFPHSCFAGVVVVKLQQDCCLNVCDSQ